jgi:hypothetical protein
MDLRNLIARRIEAGQSAERVDAELLASVPGLSEEQRAALWLYARHLAQAAHGLRVRSGGLVHALPTEPLLLRREPR